MKKIICFVLLFAICLSILGCQENPSDAECFDIVYTWLVEEGELTNAGTELSCWYSYSTYAVQVSYDTSFPESILFTMYVYNYKGYEITLHWILSKTDDSSRETYTVSIDSKTNKAYADRSFSLNKSTFVKNSPVSAGDAHNNYTDPCFNTKYTDAENQEGKRMSEIINEIHYDYWLKHLDWLGNKFCPEHGLTLKDFGYKKFTN